MKIKLTVICSAVMLLSSSFAHALLYVVQITGDPKTIELQRSGKIETLMRFMELQEGDKVVINADNTSLILLQDNRNKIVLNRSNTPYTISRQNQTKSIWNEAMLMLQDVFPPESKDKAIDAISRNSDKKVIPSNQPIKLLALNPHGDNWVTLQLPHLYFVWIGGQSPFTIKLLDEHNNILEEQRTHEYSAKLSTNKLQVGKRYRVEVSYVRPLTTTQARAIELVDERTFTIVTADKLPLEIQQLGELSLSADTIIRLKIAYLAVMPEWCHQALQEAQDTNLESIQQKVLIHCE